MSIEDAEKQFEGKGYGEFKLAVGGAVAEVIEPIRQEKNRLLEEKNALTEKKIRDEGMLERIDDENRHLQEHILEEYDLTYTSALEFKDETFEAYGAKTVISDLKKDINRLGEVNPLAVQTLEETEKRYEEQVVMRDDIQAAYDDIFKIIEELTRRGYNVASIKHSSIEYTSISSLEIYFKYIP